MTSASELLRIGVIGTGIGATHVEVFARVPGASVVAICSAHLARAQALATRHGIPFSTNDYRELISRVDAVVVATPPNLHAPMALAAIRAGKHVFCEKPLAASLAEAQALAAGATAAGVVNMVNMQLRHAPEYMAAKAIVDAGQLGRLVVADARITMNPVDYLRAPQWSDSKASWFGDASQAGGLLASSAGPHLVDLLLWLGGPIAEVAARTVVSQPKILLDAGPASVSSEDGFLVLARFVSGAIATLRGVPVAYHGGGWTLEVHGERGSLEVSDGKLRATDGRPGSDLSPEGSAPHRLRRTLMTEVALEEGSDMRLALATRFVEAARSGGATPSPSFSDGVAVQAVLDASLLAARSEAWVALEREPAR